MSTTALCAASVAWAGDAADTQAPAPAAASSDAAATTVPQVIVTARKTRERLEDVPIAISAVGGADLAREGHLRIEDLNQLTPSTNIVITNGHQTSFSVRGLGNNPGNDGLEGSAGVFLDGVYLGRPGMAAMDLIDISQIEVLRGPQGTLFGKNTTAGAVNITTEAPSFTFGGDAQASYGNYNFQQYQGTITGPLAGDQLAGRLTAFSTTRSGWVSDPTLGQNLDTLDRWGVRGQLLYRPNDEFSLRLIGEFEREQQSTGAVMMFDSLGATPSAILAKTAATHSVITASPSGDLTDSAGPAQTGTRQGGVSAEANWTKNGFTLTSLTAWRDWRYASNADAVGSSANVLAGGYNIHDSQWSQELRLKFPSMGPVDGVAGLYYFRQDLHMDQITAYGPEAAAWLSGVPDSLLPTYARLSPALAGLMLYNNSRWDVIATPTTNSYAAFGQGVWHVTPLWNITAGLRVTYETKDETVSRNTPTAATGAPIAGLASQAVAPFNVGVSSTAPSFLLSSDYHVAPGVMLYASISQGEKAGGVNPTVPGAGQTANSLKVQPETATDYEIGVKGDLFSHRMSFNLDGFYTDVSDYQATFIQTVAGSSVQLLTNVGKVRTEGVEADVTARPIAGLTVNANGSYNDAYYVSYPDGPCPVEITTQSVCNLTGRPVAGAPRWIGNVNFNYERPVAGALRAYVGAEFSYRSQYYGYLDDSRYASTGDYGLLNVRAGVRTDRWDFSLWGKNVTDRRYVANYLSYGTLLPGAYAAFFGDPMTYGATLRASF